MGVQEGAEAPVGHTSAGPQASPSVGAEANTASASQDVQSQEGVVKTMVNNIESSSPMQVPKKVASGKAEQEIMSPTTLVVGGDNEADHLSPQQKSELCDTPAPTQKRKLSVSQTLNEHPSSPPQSPRQEAPPPPLDQQTGNCGMIRGKSDSSLRSHPEEEPLPLSRQVSAPPALQRLKSRNSDDGSNEPSTAAEPTLGAAAIEAVVEAPTDHPKKRSKSTSSDDDHGAAASNTAPPVPGDDDYYQEHPLLAATDIKHAYSVAAWMKGKLGASPQNVPRNDLIAIVNEVYDIESRMSSFEAQETAQASQLRSEISTMVAEQDQVRKDKKSWCPKMSASGIQHLEDKKKTELTKLRQQTNKAVRDLQAEAEVEERDAEAFFNRDKEQAQEERDIHKQNESAVHSAKVLEEAERHRLANMQELQRWELAERYVDEQYADRVRNLKSTRDDNESAVAKRRQAEEIQKAGDLEHQVRKDKLTLHIQKVQTNSERNRMDAEAADEKLADMASKMSMAEKELLQAEKEEAAFKTRVESVQEAFDQVKLEVQRRNTVAENLTKSKERSAGDNNRLVTDYIAKFKSLAEASSIPEEPRFAAAQLFVKMQSKGSKIIILFLTCCFISN